MPEPTLSTAYSDLRSKVAHFLGYGRDPDVWTDNQAEDIDAVLKSGLRMFYHSGYDWSFLKPVATLSLVSGANTVLLPDDYAQADGPIIVSVSGESVSYRALPLGPWQPIYQAEVRQPGYQGIPQYVCEEPVKGTSPDRGQRRQLHVFPAADTNYVLTFAYRLNADALSVALPYAYGGAQHSETILQACKAAAERDIDDIPLDSPQAVHQKSFAVMLEQSKMLDRRTKPHTVGVNRDLSDFRRRGRNYLPRPLLPITVQGVIYD